MVANDVCRSSKLLRLQHACLQLHVPLTCEQSLLTQHLQILAGTGSPFRLVNAPFCLVNAPFRLVNALAGTGSPFRLVNAPEAAWLPENGGMLNFSLAMTPYPDGKTTVSATQDASLDWSAVGGSEMLQGTSHTTASLAKYSRANSYVVYQSCLKVVESITMWPQAS